MTAPGAPEPGESTIDPSDIELPPTKPIDITPLLDRPLDTY